MDGFITLLNSTGKSFTDFATSMLIQSTILITVLFVLDLVLRKRVKAVFRYCIWMLILVKLVLPTTLSSPTSLGYWFGDNLPIIATEKSSTAENTVTTMPLVAPTGKVVSPETITTLPSVDTHPQSIAGTAAESDMTAAPAVPTVSLTWQGLVFMAWLGVVITMTLLLVQRTFFVRGLIAQSQAASAEMVDIFEQGRKQMGVHRHIALRLSPVAASPSVCGLFRPAILIPQSLAGKLNSQHLRSIFLHELAHIKRGDLWVSLFQTILQIVYVYNPLLWVANAMIRKVREAAVDEMVLVAMGEQAENYPKTLLNVSRLVFSRPALSLRLIGVVESKKALTRRIRYIVSRPFPKTAKLGIVGLLGVIIIAAVLLPMAKAEKDDTVVQSSRKTPSGEIGQPDDKEMPTIVSGVVTDKLGRPRGNVYIAPQSANIWKGIRSDTQGRFTLEDVTREQMNWIAFSQASRAMGLFTIPQDYAGRSIHVTLNFNKAEVEGRVVGPEGKGLADRKVEFVVKANRGFTYLIPCYGKTDQYGNYSHSIVPCGSGLSIQARLADANEAEKRYVTKAVALRDNQIFIPMPRLVMGQDQPKETDDGKVLYSGRVVNEQGEPISGVEVHLSYRWRGSMGVWIKELMTDEHGRWKRRLPKGLSNLSLSVLHPEYIRQGQRPSPAELMNGTNVTVMKRGLHLEGIVRNQEGESVDDALIDTGGTGRTTPYGEMVENCTSPRTSADGSFSVGGLVAGSKDIVVSAVGYAPQIVRLEIEEGMEPIEVGLKTGKTYVGLVVDAGGEPIEGVKIDVGDWQVGRKRGRLTRITQTDSQGLFKIENLPDEGKLRLDFGKRDSGLLGFSKEIPDDFSGRDKIVMYRTPVFVGTVVDAESEEPIANFTLTNGIQSSAFGEKLLWSRHYKNEVTSEDGTFSRTWGGYWVTYPFDGLCCLRVEAKGYLPGMAPPLRLGEKYEPCVVRLTKAEPLKGIVVDNKGNPAVEAEVGWVGPGRTAFLKAGKFDKTGFAYQAEPIVKADSSGVFELPPSREHGLIVALHKTGYASVESKDFKDGSQIRLTPWARIEGTIVSSRENRGEFVLSIYQATPREEAESQQMRWMFDRTSFTGDNFVINFVPSTPLNIGRVVESGQDDPVYIDPQPGETYEVRFGDEGIIAAGKRMPSLLGKPLPDLTDIEIDFSPEQHKGKMILVCFWDMNQRPSRYCIRELAKRAEELNEKEVTILAVQTSKVDENKLDRWVTEYNIPFSVGMNEGDEEKIRFAWGVRSLPLLILTDNEHVVRAKGFSVSDLDEKMTMIGKKYGAF